MFVIPTNRIFLGGVVIVCLLFLFIVARSAELQAPAFEKLRFNEDYSGFADPGQNDLFDQMKYVPFGSKGFYLSLGGEVRERYEYTENPSFGADPQDTNGVWLQRLVLHADAHLGSHARVFAQLSSALSAGRNGGPSPVDEDRLAVQNAFLDLKTQLPSNEFLLFRVGRQETSLGSGRLVDVREGPNVRRTFDGARLNLDGSNDWDVSLLALRPVVPLPGVFDDGTNDEQALWGLYATTATELLPFHTNLDLYYIGYQNESATYVQGTAGEVRHSIGLRVFGHRDNWDWNWEAVGQFGTFGDDDILAWTLATDTGYTDRDLLWTPRFGLSMNIASGDHSPTDGRLETFNPLYPRGNYFSNAAVLGPRNFFNLNPSIELHLNPTLTVGAGINTFWRLEKNDGVYTPSGSILRAPAGSEKRYVATALSANISVQVSDRFSIETVFTHMQSGAFIKATGPNDPINFFEFTVKYRF